MVVRVMRGPVHKGFQDFRHAVVAVVNWDGPEVDKDEEREVERLVEREQEGVDVVGDALQEAVQPVERVARVRSRHLQMERRSFRKI